MHYATIEEPGRLNRMIGKKSDLERQKNNVLDDLCRFFREIRIFWSTTMPDFNGSLQRPDSAPYKMVMTCPP